MQKYSPHFNTAFNGILLLAQRFASYNFPSHLPDTVYIFILSYPLFIFWDPAVFKDFLMGNIVLGIWGTSLYLVCKQLGWYHSLLFLLPWPDSFYFFLTKAHWGWDVPQSLWFLLCAQPGRVQWPGSRQRASWEYPSHWMCLTLARIREVSKSLLALACAERAAAHHSSAGVRMRNGYYTFLMLCFKRNGRRSFTSLVFYFAAKTILLSAP